MRRGDLLSAILVVTGEQDAPLGITPQGLCERRIAAIQQSTFRCFFPGLKIGFSGPGLLRLNGTKRRGIADELMSLVV